MTLPAPIRVGPVLACFTYRALWAGLIATPVALALGGTVAHYPRGDALIFDPGGIHLAESLRLAAQSLPSLFGFSGILLLLAMFGWLIPLGGLIASFDPARPPFRVYLRRSAERFGSLSIMLGATLFLRALLLALFVSIGDLVAGDGGYVRQSLGAMIPITGLLLWWIIDLFHDAIRVARVHDDDEGLFKSISRGTALVWSRFASAALAASWRTLIALIAFAAALIAARHFTGGPPDRLVAVIAIHHLALLIYLLTRASWLRYLTQQFLAPTPTPAIVAPSPRDLGPHDFAPHEPDPAPHLV